MDIYVKISLAIRLTYGICILIVNLIKGKKKVLRSEKLVDEAGYSSGTQRKGNVRYRKPLHG
jgi:hypothetical protein